jgi:multidrug efflux pump subunit AcrB
LIAEFFVDRPIFATVISVVIVLAGGVAVFTLPVAQYPEVTPPTVQVTASYPGANAQTVRDTVAAPIEEQVSGVEGMMYMSSQSTNDGAYKLTVTFRLGTDSDIAQVLVQNRVSLALPVIPALVQSEGINVKKVSPNTLMIVNLISPDKRYDELFLSNYATIYIKDELGRLPGVAGITYFGQRDYSLRAWLDPDKLATLGITATDVVNAISQQNIQVAAGQIGQQPVPKGQQYQLTINTLGRLTDPEQFADIIVKAAGGGVPSQTPAATASNQANAGGAASGQSNSTSTTTTANAADGGATSATAAEPSTGIVRLRDVVTRTEDGQPRVELGSQQYEQSCTLDGQPSVALSIFQLPGSNALDTAGGIYAKMKDLKTRFPEGLDYRIVYDTTPFIRESVNEVFRTLRDAVILVAIVVLLFLQDWRAMILPMIDVPVSLIGTFVVMAAMSFTINNLTLFGLVLAIGIVVDDAIVVLENIERQIATGLDARTATIRAMNEITGPILAITLVLSSVFIPCCFLGGVSGQFFRQFAITIAVSTVISAVNALTMTPSRAALIFSTEESGDRHQLKKEALPWWLFGILGGLVTIWLGQAPLAHWLGVPLDDSGSYSWMPWAIDALAFIPGAIVGGVIGWFIIRPINAALGLFFQAFNRFFDVVVAIYGRAVGGLLRISAIAILAYVGLLAVTYWQFNRTPTGFIPQQDKGYLILNVQLPDSASVERTDAVMARVEKLAHDTPGVEHTVGISGQSLILNANAPNLGSLYVMLKSFDERRTSDLTADAIAADLQKRCRSEVSEAIVSAFGAPPIDGLGSTGGFRLIIEDRGNLGLGPLQRVSQQIVANGNRTSELKDLFNSSGASTPWLYLDINRTKCEALGVSVADLFNTLQIYLGSYYVNNFNQFGRTWQVNVQADPHFRNGIPDVRQLQVRNNQGQMVRLATLLDVRDTSGPVMVLRYNLYSAAAITGDAAPGASSGQALERMERVAAKDLPASMAYEWTDLAFLQLEAGNTAMWFFVLAVAFVFLVLAAQYESWSLPLAVILVVPMCLLCSVVGVQIAHHDINIFTQIGFIVLVGLASKNAILIVEFAKVQHEAGADRRQATLDAVRLRLRPILMTSFAFILGVVPLVIAAGAGAEMRRTLGVAVFGGMLGVTLFGIFLTPVFFYVVQSLKDRRTSGTRAHAVAPTTSPPAETKSIEAASRAETQPPPTPTRENREEDIR